MKAKILLLGMLMGCCGATTFAQAEWKVVELGDISKSRSERNDVFSQHLDIGQAADCSEELPRRARVKKQSSSDVKFKDVTLTQSGTLASILGDEINDIDSLVVRGPINADDFHTMWSSSFYGGLTVINLEYATVEGGKIPKRAFFYQSEQYTPGSEYINCIPLRRIILPEGLEEIGDHAFVYAISLESVNLPSSLKTMARGCFEECVSLYVNPLVVPEGVEEIGNRAFLDCRALTAKVVLPGTLKRIGNAAFFQSKIVECNFPEGLEEIGDAAFYATRLKEAILPNTCQSLPGDSHFMINWELEKVKFPEGVTEIPGNFVCDCFNLKEFIMPNSIERIGYQAFWQCAELKELHLSSALRTIDTEGLYYCKGLKEISLPSTLDTLGQESCLHWKRIERIYCAAETPPICIKSTLNLGWTPFGQYGSDFVNRTPQETPIYVPVGSADLYRNAWGWDYFTNFIETDFTGIQDISQEEENGQKEIYDLQGRKVTHPIPNQLYIMNGKKCRIDTEGRQHALVVLHRL